VATWVEVVVNGEVPAGQRVGIAGGQAHDQLDGGAGVGPASG